MFFLLRMAFWLSVVCVLLPNSTKSTSPDANIDATQAVTLASAAVSDARGHKAEAGARTIYEFITTKLSKNSAPGDQTAAKIVSVTAPGQGTLTASDVQPAWHAPVPLPPRREARTGRPAV